MLRALQPKLTAFAGRTAAWLHGLDVDPTPVEVVVPPGSGLRSRAGLEVHRVRIPEVVMVRGLPATTVPRTFNDLKRRLPTVDYLVLADQALRLGLGRYHELAERAESPMETRLRWLLIASGLPRPQVQVDLHNSNGRFVGRADLFFPQARLAIEYDGANHRDRLIDDNRRQNALINAGYRLLRFTAPDLTQRPGAVVALVRAGLQEYRGQGWQGQRDAV
jgi:very-short-patch-repair endonuclease